MARNQNTSAVVDGLLRLLATGGLLATSLLIPNALKAFDKPLNNYFNKLDERAREREYKRLLRYMKQQELIVYHTKEYEHGIQLTKRGQLRAAKVNLDYLSIQPPQKWDQKWRIILFDIPETNKTARDYFTSRLRTLGFVQLQKSAWVHPFPCREEVAAVAQQYGIRRYVTYLETTYIEAPEKLKNRFTFSF